MGGRVGEGGGERLGVDEPPWWLAGLWSLVFGGLEFGGWWVYEAWMKKTFGDRRLWLSGLGAVLLVAAGVVPLVGGDEVYEVLFDGKSLAGWHVSAETGHSRASGNKTGGKWVVEDGAIVGSQDIPGNGGIIITDEKFGDFEVVLEMRNDFGPDSGLFLRGTEDGKAYQAMIDYHGRGNVMGIYGEGLGGFVFRPFQFDGSPDRIVVSPEVKDFPVLPESWSHFWRHGEWNEFRARIEGNPPAITTWINGVKMAEWKDTEKRLPDTGGIALQVHGGGDLTRQFVRYRNIRVKRLD
jgi:hypothetical protein